MATFSGTNRADTITPDLVSAGVVQNPAGATPSAAADTINGLGGDDILDGGGGRDTINGGDGRDTITYSGGGSVVHGDNDDDEITFSPERDAARSAAAAIDISGAANGDAGNDDLTFAFVTTDPASLAGTIALHGDVGNDRIGVWADSYEAAEPIDFDAARFEQYGGPGDDSLHAMYNFYIETLNYGAADDYLFGGPGNDTYELQESADAVIEKPGEGYDTVIGIADDYTLAANVEKLQLVESADSGALGWRGTGNALDNVIIGDAGDDTLLGLGGNDTIFGSHGENFGDADDDADVIHGGAGNDKIYGGGSIDDRADGSDTIFGNAGNDTVWAGGGDDTVYGGPGEDKLYGQSGSDRLYGGDDRDWLGGGSGNDRLYGEGGPDILFGRDGADRLSGGGGNDRYDYDYVTDSRPGAANRDVILDFAGVGGAVGDRIDLSTIDANTSAGGNQAFVFRGTAAFTGAGQVRVLASGADTLIQANTGGSLAPELEILVKDGTATPGQWVAGDFIL